MTILLILAFVIPTAAQLPAQTARVYGRVVAADSGAPVRSANVRLSGLPPSLGTFLVSTDIEGRFDIGQLPAGQFSLQVSKPNFSTTSFGLTPRTSQPFALKAGQQADLGDLRLPRAGVIVGRVHDTFNDPIAEISVTAWQVDYLEPSQRRVRSVKVVQTNDLGEFRLYGLRPGKYFVSASRRAVQVSASAGGSSGVTTVDTGLREAPTFFPGTASAAEAIPVEVRVGEDTLGTNIPLLTVSYGRVTGSVTDSKGNPYDAVAWLVPARADGALVSTVQLASPTDQQGRFTIVDVSPGDYRVEVFSRAWMEKVGQTGGPGVGPVGEVGSSPITVVGGRTEEVSVQTSAGFRWRGRVLLDGGQVPGGAGAGIRVNATAMSSGGPSGLAAPSSSPLAADSSFVLEGIQGSRIIRAQGLPSGSYLQRVMHRGNDVTDRGIEIDRTDTDGIEIHLTTKPTRLDGEVRDAAGSPVANARIIIFSPDRADWMRPMTRRFTATMSNDQGKFAGAGMPAGNYLAAVIPEDDRDRSADPDFIDSLRPFATPLTLTDGTTTTVVLQKKR